MIPTKLNVKKELSTVASEISEMAARPADRRAAGLAAIAGKKFSAAAIPPDPEVREKKVRRTFSAKYKLKILEETDNCTESGQIGKVLRCEGLYFSNLTLWRDQRNQGILQGISPKKRGRKKKQKNPLTEELARLRKENNQLISKLKKAELIIEAQKKISALLESTIQVSKKMKL